MSSISERRELAKQQIQNLIAEHKKLGEQINLVKNEANQQIRNFETQQQNIAITVAKLEGKLEVYNEEEPTPPADVIPLKSDDKVKEPDDAS